MLYLYFRLLVTWCYVHLHTSGRRAYVFLPAWERQQKCLWACLTVWINLLKLNLGIDITLRWYPA